MTLTTQLIRPDALSRGPRCDAAVVFDVMRASTTASALIASGCDELLVVDRPALVESVRYSEFNVFTELSVRGGKQRFDNSPVVARSLTAHTKTSVLVTTNGTRAMCAAARMATRVFVSSFVNVSTTAAHLRELGVGSVALIPAGRFETAEPRLEDDLAAYVCECTVRGLPWDRDDVVRRCKADVLLSRRIAGHPALGADLDVALAFDCFPAVLAFVASDERAGTISRIA